MDDGRSTSVEERETTENLSTPTTNNPRLNGLETSHVTGGREGGREGEREDVFIITNIHYTSTHVSS